MEILRILLVLLSTLLAADTALGGPKHCDPADDTSCVQTVLQGEPVPFTGVLSTPRRAAIQAVQAEQATERREQAVEEAVRLVQIDLATEQAKRQADNDACNLKLGTQRDLLHQMNEQLQPRWYEHPALWFGVGVVVSVGVVMGAARLVEVGR